MGYPPDEVGQVIASEFLSCSENDRNGALKLEDLSIEEVDSYINSVRDFAAKEFSCRIPWPNDPKRFFYHPSVPSIARFSKELVFESEAYLAHVRQFPCCVCQYPDVHAHHIRFSHIAGVGMKPPDTWAIPLCPKHHAEWHSKGITTFQKEYEIDIYQVLFIITKSWIEKGGQC